MDVFHLLIYSRKEEISILPLFFHIWIVVLGKTLESPLDYKTIQTVNLKGNQPWIFIGRADAEAPIFWLPHVKSHLIGKDPDAGKDWRQEEKEVTKDEMVGSYHQLNGHESEQTLRDSEGQGSLVCCSPRGCRVEHDLATEQQWVATLHVGSGIFFVVVWK